jgi:hypothetical protein
MLIWQHLAVRYSLTYDLMGQTLVEVEEEPASGCQNFSASFLIDVMARYAANFQVLWW